MNMDYLLNNLPDPIWQKIALIDELKGRWHAGARLNQQILGRLKRSVLITSTGASTRIEGARLDDQQIDKLMRGISLKRLRGRDKQEVRGYFELLSNVFESWPRLNFSENLIKSFHQQLLKYVAKDKRHRGEYKKQENKVILIDTAGRSAGVLFDTAPAYLAPKEMLDLVEWAKGELGGKTRHPLLVIAGFIVKFLQIHPFIDGNGRHSRILTNLLLLQAGYSYMPYVSHEKLIEDNKPGYYLALRQSQKTFKSVRPTIIPWLEFFLEMVLRQAKLATALLAAENIDKLLSPAQLKTWEYLQKTTEVTPKELSEKLSIPRPTVNQVLNKLLELKKIERLGQGRSTRYKKIASPGKTG